MDFTDYRQEALESRSFNCQSSRIFRTVAHMMGINTDNDTITFRVVESPTKEWVLVVAADLNCGQDPAPFYFDRATARKMAMALLELADIETPGEKAAKNS